MKKGFTLIGLMVVAAVIGVLSAIAVPRYSDSTRGARAAQVHGNLHNIQVGINMFYAEEGHYPELGVDIGAGKDGASFSETFQEYYSREGMPETPPGGRSISGDSLVRKRVYDIGERDLIGGWLYDEEKGRVYARLENDAYGQGNIWIDERAFSSLVRIYDGMILSGSNGKWTSGDEFSEYTMETTFEIGSSGRMEIYLEGGEEGYKLRINPVMQQVHLIKVVNGREEKISTTDVKEILPKKTWFTSGGSKEVPVRVDVSSTQDGGKSVSLEIAGVRVPFDGKGSIEYTPQNESSQVGIGNKPKSDRELEVGDIKITSK